MTIGVVIRRKLSFDIRQRDISSNSDIHALGYFGNIEIHVIHDGIVSIGLAAPIREQLLAENTLGCCIAIIKTV